MSTNRQVIQSALRKISVLDANQDASAEDGQLALEAMNDLMALLSGEGIDFGYPPQDSLNDDFPLGATEEAQVKPLLAVQLFTYFPSGVVSPTLAGEAEMARRQMLRTAVLLNREESSVTHLPLGESGTGVWDISSDSFS